MSILSSLSLEQLRSINQNIPRRLGSKNCSGLSSPLSCNRGESLWQHNTWMVDSVSTPRIPQQDTRSLPFRWEHSSGSGSSNGDNFRPISGRGPDGRPRFNQPVNSGGYLWWYIDGTSEDGRNALTIIVFVGSVFSPYYSNSQKKDKKVNPEDFCAFNVALYQPDKNIWTMTERSSDYVERKAESFTIGKSSIKCIDSIIEITIDEVSSPFPQKVQGTVKINCDKFLLYRTWLDDNHKHRWGPIAPSASIEVDIPSHNISWKGHGYVDSNEGDEPLEIPFKEWDWARTYLEDGSAVVFYDVKQRVGRQRVLPLRFFPNGDVERIAPPPRQDLPDSRWMISRVMRSEPARPAHILRVLEDTPFYSRILLSSGLLNDRRLVIHETLNLDRFSSKLTKLMLPWRMPRMG